MEFINTPYLRGIYLKSDAVPSFKKYPFNIPSIRFLQELSFHEHVTFIVGENGTGKSTLLEAMAISLGFNPEGGSLNFNFSTYDSHSNLTNFLKVIRGIIKPKDGFFLRAESFYNVATNIEQLDTEFSSSRRVIDSYGGVSLHDQSHGEAFFSTLMNRFGGNGIYILDEPEAALSPLRQLSMLSRIHELVKQNSQFIIATHSPMLMAYPSSKIFELTGSGIKESTLEETGHYRVMKQFFKDKNLLMHHLFRDND